MAEKKSGKVLILGQHYWPEPFRVTDIAEGLAERGYDIEVLCGIPNYPKGKFYEGYSFFKKRSETRNGVKIIRVPEIPRGNNSNFRIFINYISFPFFALFYVPMLLSKKYQTLIVYQLSPVFMSLPAIIVAKLTKKPLYFYVCDFWPHSLFSIINFRLKFIRKLLTHLSYWHYKQADGLICAYKGIQEKFISEVGIEKNKTIYIPQAPEKFYETVIEDKVLIKKFKGSFNYLFAGNINPAQSFDVITQAAKIVLNKGFKNIKYVIVGDGMSKPWLELEVDRLGLKDQFIFEGYVPTERIPAYHNIADAFIVALSKSSLFEYAIPAKINSYLVAGKPIVAAMDGDGQDLINKRSKSGICVNSGDIEGLAQAIIKIAKTNSKERKEIGNRGFKYYYKFFERNYNLNRLIEFVFNNKIIEDKEYST